MRGHPDLNRASVFKMLCNWLIMLLIKDFVLSSKCIDHSLTRGTKLFRVQLLCIVFIYISYLFINDGT